MNKERILQIVDACESGYTNVQIMDMFNISHEELIEVLGPLGLNEDYVERQAWRNAKKQAYEDGKQLDLLDSDTLMLYYRKAFLSVMRRCRLKYFELVFDYKNIDIAKLKAENRVLSEKLAVIRKLVI